MHYIYVYSSSLTFVSQSEIPKYLTPLQLKGWPIRLAWAKNKIFWGAGQINSLSAMADRARPVDLYTGAVLPDGRLKAMLVLEEDFFRHIYAQVYPNWLRPESLRGYLESEKEKFCGGCNRTLRRDRFARRVGNVDGLDHRCLYCRHKEDAIEAERNGDIRRMRMLHAEGSHTLHEWMTLLKSFKFHCVCCGLHGSVLGSLSKDHIVPIACGGSDFISNIQPLCRSCNSRKGTKTIDYRDSFRQKLEQLHSVDEFPCGNSGGAGGSHSFSC